MMRFYIRLITTTLLGVITGCAPLDQYGGSSPYYSGNNNNSSNNYPYSGYGARYPSSGYETEYRKAQQHMNSQNGQAIVDGITQRMLNSGWYPEGMSGNQLVFTRIRDQHDKEIYYKTVYTLVPSAAGYTVYANMKLKTMDNPYRGSLDEAARNVDDKTENLLKSVSKAVSQKPITATPIPTIPTKIPVIKKPYKNTQVESFSNQLPPPTVQQRSVPVMSVPENLPTQKNVEPDMNKLFEQTPTVPSMPVETQVMDQQQQDDQYQQIDQQLNAQQNGQDKAKKRKEKGDENERENSTQQEDDLESQTTIKEESTVTIEPAVPQ
jgi:hypothetical protein